MATFIQPAQRLGNVEEYYFSRKLREIARMRASGKRVLNLGIGSPDLPPAPEVIHTLKACADEPDQHGYQPYRGIPELRQAFTRWYEQFFGVTLDADTEVLPLMGSKEGIMHISMAFLGPGDEVLVPDPGYPTYRAVTALTGATARSYALRAKRDWLPDLEALEKTDLSRVKIMWINYPHMPTGKVAERAFFSDLVAFARRNRILLCNDNPYAFILNEEPLSLLSIPGAKDMVMELSSLSKAYNMAGWRIGMMAGSADHLSTVLRFKSNMDSGMFRPLQLAAVKALQSPPEWYGQINAVYRGRRERVYALFDRLECTYRTGQAGLFIWAKIPDRYANAYLLSDWLLREAHVFITPGGIFGQEGLPYLRISLCSDYALYDEALHRLENLTIPQQLAEQTHDS